jgi:hypothetical protein
MPDTKIRPKQENDRAEINFSLGKEVLKLKGNQLPSSYPLRWRIVSDFAYRFSQWRAAHYALEGLV